MLIVNIFSVLIWAKVNIYYGILHIHTLESDFPKEAYTLKFSTQRVFEEIQKSTIPLVRQSLNVYLTYLKKHKKFYTLKERVDYCKKLNLHFISPSFRLAGWVKRSWKKKEDFFFFQQLCKKYTKEGEFVVLPGFELTDNTVHLCVSGIEFKKLPPRPIENYANIFFEIHKQNGIIWIAHPTGKYMGGYALPFEDINEKKYNRLDLLNGLAVCNDASYRLIKKADINVYPAGSIWDKFLKREWKLFIFGECDLHAEVPTPEFGYHTINCVYAKKLDAKSIINSLKNGNFYIVRTPYLGKYPNFKFYINSEEVFAGMVLKLNQQDTLKIHVYYKPPYSAKIKKFEIIKNGQILKSYSNTSKEKFFIKDKINKNSYYRIWLCDEKNGYVFSNPIFVEVKNAEK